MLFDDRFYDPDAAEQWRPQSPTVGALNAVAAPPAAAAPVALSDSVDPYAAIRTLPATFRPAVATQEEYGENGQMRDTMIPEGWDIDFESLRPAGFQSKYNGYEMLPDGTMAVTLQQPGAHKYDTMKAIYAQDANGQWQLQDGHATRQKGGGLSAIIRDELTDLGLSNRIAEGLSNGPGSAAALMVNDIAEGLRSAGVGGTVGRINDEVYRNSEKDINDNARATSRAATIAALTGGGGALAGAMGGGASGAAASGAVLGGAQASQGSGDDILKGMAAGSAAGLGSAAGSYAADATSGLGSTGSAMVGGAARGATTAALGSAARNNGDIDWDSVLTSAASGSAGAGANIAAGGGPTGALLGSLAGGTVAGLTRGDNLSESLTGALTTMARNPNTYTNLAGSSTGSPQSSGSTPGYAAAMDDGTTGGIQDVIGQAMTGTGEGNPMDDTFYSFDDPNSAQQFTTPSLYDDQPLYADFGSGNTSSLDPYSFSFSQPYQNPFTYDESDNASPGDTPGTTGGLPTGQDWLSQLGGMLGNAASGAGGWLQKVFSGDQTARNQFLGGLGLLNSLRQSGIIGGGGSRSGSSASPAQLRSMVAPTNDTWSDAQKTAAQRTFTAPLTQYQPPTAAQAKARYGVDPMNPGYARGGGVAPLNRIAADVQALHRGPGYVAGGEGGGQDDMVEAQLSPGEYVFDADVVSALGDGSNEAGAAKLDQMREHIRAHKRAAPAHSIPPKAKGALQYLHQKA